MIQIILALAVVLGVAKSEFDLACSPTTAAVRKMQPDSSYLSDENLVKYSAYIDEAANRFRLDPNLLIVMTYGETKFHQDIKNTMQVSEPWSSGSAGPYYCGNARKDPYSSIMCGAHILRQCSDRFKGHSIYLCWSGFNIKDRESFLNRIDQRWKMLSR